MKTTLSLKTVFALVLFLLQLSTVTSIAATVKPLEVFSEKIIVLEIEYFAAENSLSSALLRKSVDRLNREMNIMSKGTAAESLKILTDVSEKLTAAISNSAALSRYLKTNSAMLKRAGHGKYIPLAEMDEEIERDYFRALSSFLETAFAFARLCHDNFDAIRIGKEEERKRYEESYAAYLKKMEQFNTQSIGRSQLLAEMGTDYPELWELMPR